MERAFVDDNVVGNGTSLLVGVAATSKEVVEGAAGEEGTKLTVGLELINVVVGNIEVSVGCITAVVEVDASANVDDMAGSGVVVCATTGGGSIVVVVVVLVCSGVEIGVLVCNMVGESTVVDIAVVVSSVVLVVVACAVVGGSTVVVIVDTTGVLVVE